MQAVILAAGEGKRLRPLTEDRPKPMVLVGGKPILEYTLSILPKEIDEVILVVGYKQEKIKEYFGDEWQGKKLIYVNQPEAKGTGDALERARPFLRPGKFLMLHGDDLFHPEDLSLCVNADELTLLAKETDRPQQMGICFINEQGYLQGIIEKPEVPPSNLANVGVYVLDHDIFDMPKVLVKDEHYLAPQVGSLSQKKPIKVLAARFWHPIGYPDDVDKAHKHVETPIEERKN